MFTSGYVAVASYPFCVLGRYVTARRPTSAVVEATHRLATAARPGLGMRALLFSPALSWLASGASARRQCMVVKKLHGSSQGAMCASADARAGGRIHNGRPYSRSAHFRAAPRFSAAPNSPSFCAVGVAVALQSSLPKPYSDYSPNSDYTVITVITVNILLGCSTRVAACLFALIPKPYSRCWPCPTLTSRDETDPVEI